MKRVWAGIGLLAVAGLGTTVFAAPSSAGEPKPEPTDVVLGATWSPNPAAPGAEVTLTPDVGCPILKGTQWGDAEPGVVALHSETEGLLEAEEVPMDDEGMWSLEVDAPDTPGIYTVEAECRTSIWAEEMEWCGLNEPVDEVEAAAGAPTLELVSYSRPAAPTWTFDCVFEFYEASFTVEAPATPPPPATPVEEPPDDTA